MISHIDKMEKPMIRRYEYLFIKATTHNVTKFPTYKEKLNMKFSSVIISQ